MATVPPTVKSKCHSVYEATALGSNITVPGFPFKLLLTIIAAYRSSKWETEK